MASITLPTISEEAYEKYLKGFAEVDWEGFDLNFRKRLLLNRMKHAGLLPISNRKEPITLSLRDKADAEWKRWHEKYDSMTEMECWQETTVATYTTAIGKLGLFRRMACWLGLHPRRANILLAKRQVPRDNPDAARARDYIPTRGNPLMKRRNFFGAVAGFILAPFGLFQDERTAPVPSFVARNLITGRVRNQVSVDIQQIIKFLEVARDNRTGLTKLIYGIPPASARINQKELTHG